MKRIILLLILFCPIFSNGQKNTEYYANGKIKSDWKVDTKSGINFRYYYFETGELNAIAFYDSIGVLFNQYQFNRMGDTIFRSKIPKFKAQQKKDLGFINWNYTKSGIGFYYENQIDGVKINTGDSVTIKYIGYFVDGSQFDNSEITGRLLILKIGEGKFLKSFEDAVMLFKVGQKGYIKITPELGYGNKPTGNLPPNSTLIYEIEIK